MKTTYYGLKDDFSIEIYSTKEEAKNADCLLCISYWENPEIENIEHRYKFQMHDFNENDSFNYNEWTVRYIITKKYFGRIKLGLLFFDPNNSSTSIESGGTSIQNFGIYCIKDKLEHLFHEFEEYSCFSSLHMRDKFFKIQETSSQNK